MKRYFRFNWRTALFLTAMLAVMVVIFVLSHQSGGVSAGTSGNVAGAVGLKPNGDTPADKVPLAFGFSLRKYAHVFLYGLLGASAAWFCISALKPCRFHYVIAGAGATGISVLYAISDEIHQLFIPDRFGKATDVLIDSIGIILAVPLALVAYWGVTKFIKYLQNNNQTLDNNT